MNEASGAVRVQCQVSSGKVSSIKHDFMASDVFPMQLRYLCHRRSNVPHRVVLVECIYEVYVCMMHTVLFAQVFEFEYSNVAEFDQDVSPAIYTTAVIWGRENSSTHTCCVNSTPTKHEHSPMYLKPYTLCVHTA